MVNVEWNGGKLNPAGYCPRFRRGIVDPFIPSPPPSSQRAGLTRSDTIGSTLDRSTMSGLTRDPRPSSDPIGDILQRINSKLN